MSGSSIPNMDKTVKAINSLINRGLACKVANGNIEVTAAGRDKSFEVIRDVFINEADTGGMTEQEYKLAYRDFLFEVMSKTSAIGILVDFELGGFNPKRK